MDYRCTIFFPVLFFALGVNVFCSIWLSPTCVCMLGIQLSMLHVCGVGLGLGLVAMVCQLVLSNYGFSENIKRYQRKVPSLQQLCKPFSSTSSKQ